MSEGNLSARLRTAAELGGAMEEIADIGTDHAFLPIYLISRGLCKRAVASDIRLGPLSRAREHIELAGLADRIETRLCPGVDERAMAGCDAFFICGMGGEMIAGILQDSELVKQPGRKLILQPMTAAEDLRQYLLENGFVIEEERLCREEVKLYVLLRAAYTGQRQEDDPFYYRLGRALLKSGDPLLPVYLERERERLQKELDGLKKARSGNWESEIKHREEWIARILSIEEGQ